MVHLVFHIVYMSKCVILYSAKWIHSQSQANINNPWVERRGGGDLMAFDVLGNLLWTFIECNLLIYNLGSPFIRVYVQAINGFTFGKTYGLGDIEVENQYSFSFSIINNKRFQFAFYVKVRYLENIFQILNLFSLEGTKT